MSHDLAGAMAAAHDDHRDSGSRLRLSHRSRAARCEDRLRAHEFVRLRRREREPDSAEVDMSASDIFVVGTGAVSPAGWGVPALVDAVSSKAALPIKELTQPASTKPLRVRQVPPANPKPAWLSHARLRRTSPITHYSVAAALEALGDDAARIRDGSINVGVIVCVMSGCVNYSRRFYDETLRDPATASPLVFPETVFNAPSSHLAALIGTEAINYTVIGDPGTFLQ